MGGVRCLDYVGAGSMIVYLSTTDIAVRLGVTHSAVSQMKRRGRLPVPDAVIADRFGWLEKTIEMWEARR